MALVVDIAVHGIGRSEVTAVAKAFVNALESRVDFVEIDDRAFLEIRKLLDLCGLARRSTRNPDRAQVVHGAFVDCNRNDDAVDGFRFFRSDGRERDTVETASFV